MFNFYCNFNTEITCLACSRYRNVRSKLFQTAPETTGTQLSFHKKRVRYKLTFSEKQINCMLKLQLTDRVYNNRIAAAQSPCLHHSSFRYFPKSNFALFALFFLEPSNHLASLPALLILWRCYLGLCIKSLILHVWNDISSCPAATFSISLPILLLIIVVFSKSSVFSYLVAE